MGARAGGDKLRIIDSVVRMRTHELSHAGPGKDSGVFCLKYIGTIYGALSTTICSTVLFRSFL